MQCIPADESDVYELVAETSVLTVCAIDDSRHLEFLLERADPEHVSFMQTPTWGRIKATWRAESIGWFAEGELVGTALVLFRDLPTALLGRRPLAYIPEGPTVDWFGSGRRAADWIEPLVAYLRRAKAFSVKLGPKLPTRRWSAATVRAGMADPARTGFTGLPEDAAWTEAARLVLELGALGWRREGSTDHGIADMQPRHFLRLPLEGRTEAEVLAGFSQQWRRNVRASERAGVKVWRAGPEDLPVFHAMYVETARRDGFIPRPLEYFQQMFREVLAADPDGMRLYLAGADGVASAGATMIRFGRRACFSYGASTTERRNLRASNAVQWGMVQDCLSDGMEYYDMRGVGETLDPEHPMFGLLRFKLGTGCEVIEYPGEYDLALNRILHSAMRIYMRLAH